MTTAEAMAIAVLKGDMVAARALADHLLEDYPPGGRELPPLTKIRTDAADVRVVLWLRDGIRATGELIREAHETIADWLDDGQTLVLPPEISRLDIYEIDRHGV